MNKTAKLIFALSLPFLFPSPFSHSYTINHKNSETIQQYKSVQKMNLEEKIGQLIITNPPPRAWKNRKVLKDFIKKNKIGGVIYFYWELKGKTKEQIKEMSDQMQGYSEIPLFIGADIEGGLVNRIKDIRHIPSAGKYGRSYENSLSKGEFLDHFRNDAKNLAALLNELGINLNFGPVLDLKSEGTFEQYQRTYSKNPKIVAELASVWIKELQKNGIAAIAKHFPGHGHADKDSHDGIAAITKDKKYIEENDLVPFYKAIKSGVAGIMVGYLNGPYDSMPAVFSNKTIAVLKDKLKYKGLVVTDDLNMPCVTDRDHAKMAIDSIKAGNNILLDVKAKEIPYIIRSIKRAVQTREIDEKQIDYSVYKILKQKGYFKNETQIKHNNG